MPAAAPISYGEPMSSPVVIAGQGALAESLHARLSPTHHVRLATVDYTCLHEAEVALAGARTVVMLARAEEPVARLPRADVAELDRLMADSVARAARAVGASRLVLAARGADDVQAELLARSGVPLVVAQHELDALATHAGPAVDAPSATVTRREPKERLTCSIHRYRRPRGMTALDFARAYFEWLPRDTPLTRVVEREGTFTIFVGGVRALVLRHVPGRSSEHLAWLEPLDGALVDRSATGRFEFRVLLDEETVLASLIDFRPALPFPLYRFTQAVMHERSMRHFRAWLEARA